MELSFAEISILVSIFGVIIGAWINSRISIAKLQTEVEYIKEEIKEEKQSNAEHYKSIYKKLDLVLEKISDLRK